MDSTFLGLLAGFGLKLQASQKATDAPLIALYKPNARIIELLEALGVTHLFRAIQGSLASPPGTEEPDRAPSSPQHEDVERMCLEAHRTLTEIDPDNLHTFKDVTQFLAEDLKVPQSHSPPKPS
ncbi:MAG: hypothetical protein NT154_23680 [Verrucomicrobia bacterium]|nr:hypothetical protein [Verrucomicrobiota bacterium]